MSEGRKDRTELIRFLDRARREPSIQAQKRRILERLDLRPGDKVLDVACGTGDDARDIAELVGEAGFVAGIDKSEAMIAEAQVRSEDTGLPVEFRPGDVRHLDFEDNVFDAVRSERLFEHLDDPRLALSEMIRVTRPGGRIVASSPDMGSNVLDLPNRTVTRKIADSHCDRFANGWAGRRLYGLFVSAGLVDVVAEGVAHVGTDYAVLVEVLELRERAELARREGRITAEEADLWLDELEQAGQNGTFFMSTTHFVVRGSKP